MAQLEIIQAQVPVDHPIRSHQTMAPRWITIHETANPSLGADDLMHARYLLTREAIDRTVLWHATVDQDSVRQHLPWTEIGWHAGDGLNGPGNTRSIGVELCINADGDFAKTQRLAARLVAHLVRTVPSLAPFPECVVQHNHWSGKNCPAQIRATPGGWENFLDLCREEITIAAGGVPVRIDGRLVDVGARLEGGSTRAGLRQLAEALGAVVTWIPPEEGGPAVEIKRGAGR